MLVLGVLLTRCACKLIAESAGRIVGYNKEVRLRIRLNFKIGAASDAVRAHD